MLNSKIINELRHILISGDYNKFDEVTKSLTYDNITNILEGNIIELNDFIGTTDMFELEERLLKKIDDKILTKVYNHEATIIVEGRENLIGKNVLKYFSDEEKKKILFNENKIVKCNTIDDYIEILNLFDDEEFVSDFVFSILKNNQKMDKVYVYKFIRFLNDQQIFDIVIGKYPEIVVKDVDNVIYAIKDHKMRTKLLTLLPPYEKINVFLKTFTFRYDLSLEDSLSIIESLRNVNEIDSNTISSILFKVTSDDLRIDIIKGKYPNLPIDKNNIKDLIDKLSDKEKYDLLTSNISNKWKESFFNELSINFDEYVLNKIYSVELVLSLYENNNLYKEFKDKNDFYNFLNTDKSLNNPKILYTLSGKDNNIGNFDENEIMNILFKTKNYKYMCMILNNEIKNINISKKDIYWNQLLKELIYNYKEFRNYSMVIDIFRNSTDEYNKQKFLLLNTDNNSLYDKYQIHYSDLEDYINNKKTLVNIISENYNLNNEHLYTLVNLLGLNILNYLENDNIKNMINLEDHLFHNYVDLLIDNENFNIDKNKINTIFNILVQRKIRVEYSSLFTLAIDIINCNDEKELDSLFAKYNFEDYINNHSEYNLKELKHRLLNDREKKEIYSIIHNLTNNFISDIREKYIRTQNELLTQNISNITVKFEKSKTIKLLPILLNKKELKKYISNIKIDNIDSNELKKYKLTKEDIQLFLSDIDFIDMCIDFKKGGYNLLKPDAKELKMFDVLLEYIYENDYKDIFDNKLTNEFNKRNVSKVYEINKITNIDKINMLCLINPLKLKGTYLHNKQIRDELKNILKHYSLLGVRKTFSEYSNNADLLLDDKTISEIINEFYKIYPYFIKDKSLTNLVESSLIFSYKDFKYTALLGEENQELLIKNPTPNAGLGNKDERMKMVPKYVYSQYLNTHSSIPYINEYVNINGKTIHIVLGDKTNPDNLTLGEKTSSCMRICGVGTALFDRCTTTLDGFHLKFYDENDKLISRISGFRNGNTIFLNELRYPLNLKYTKDDLIKCISLVSKKLVAETKKDKIPISNVIASRKYALETCDLPSVRYLSSKINAGLDNCYTDLTAEDDVLFYPKKEKKMDIKPYSFYPTVENTIYPVLRQEVKINKRRTISFNNEIAQIISKIFILNKLLNLIDFDDIETPIIENDILYIEDLEINLNDIDCIKYGEDWFAIYNKNNELINYKYATANGEFRPNQKEEIMYYLKEELNNKNISKTY